MLSLRFAWPCEGLALLSSLVVFFLGVLGMGCEQRKGGNENTSVSAIAIGDNAIHAQTRTAYIDVPTVRRDRAIHFIFRIIIIIVRDTFNDKYPDFGYLIPCNVLPSV